MAIFTGSGVALVTPFLANGEVDFDTYEKLVDFHAENGTDAIISCGTTGEASALTDEEQLELIRVAAARAKGRIPVIAGAGSNVTSHGVELCKGSQKAGADACLVVTPYYNKTSQRGLIEHFTLMAKSIDIPIMLYNVPSRTGLNIKPETVKALSNVENITAIKEASGDIGQVADIAAICGDKIDIYAGNDNEILPVLSLGGKGVVSVLANVAPKQTHDMVLKFINGDIKAAKKLQLDAVPLVNALFSDVNPIPVKAAMNIMGLNVGTYRMPLIPPSDAVKATLQKEMAAYGLIT